MPKLSKEKKLKHCSTCEEDFYNGNNPYGVKECWNLDEAKLVLRKEVGINQVPPWKQKPIKVLNCFRRKGYVYTNPDSEF